MKNKNRLKWFRTITHLFLITALISSVYIKVPVASANVPWFQDASDAGTDVRMVWVYFSTEYSSNYNTTAKIDAIALEMKTKKVDRVVASLTSADLVNLSNKNKPRTIAYQRLVNDLNQYGIQVFTGYWEDEFMPTGQYDPAGAELPYSLSYQNSSSEINKVDHVIAFNNNNDPVLDTDIIGVTTDYEMHNNPASKRFIAVDGTKGTKARNPDNYERWKKFHYDLKQRIISQNASLKLLPIMNDPSYYVFDCKDYGDAAISQKTCAQWKIDQNILGSNRAYTNDYPYFTHWNGNRFADAMIGMYYEGSAAIVNQYSSNDIIEASNMIDPVPIIVGFSAGPNTIDPTLATESEITDAVNLIMNNVSTYPSGALGAMGWRWDDPLDTDAEYRGVITPAP